MTSCDYCENQEPECLIWSCIDSSPRVLHRGFTILTPFPPESAAPFVCASTSRGGVIFMARRTCCTFPDCEEPKHEDEAMCREHTRAWMRSKAFEAAVADKGVRFAFTLSKKFGMREVAKHRRRWAKAEATREEEGA